MARPLISWKEACGGPDSGWARIPSTFVSALSLAASVAESVTLPSIPTSKNLVVVFSCTGSFYANPLATATVPGDTTTGLASELNPTVWRLPRDVTTLSVIAPGACVLTISIYVDE